MTDETTKEVNFCVNCRFCMVCEAVQIYDKKLNVFLQHQDHVCLRKTNRKMDLVSGTFLYQKKGLRRCEDERKAEKGNCGPEGKYFEASYDFYRKKMREKVLLASARSWLDIPKQETEQETEQEKPKPMAYSLFRGWYLV